MTREDEKAEVSASALLQRKVISLIFRPPQGMPSATLLATEPDGSGEGLLQFISSAWTDALGRRVVQQDFGRWLPVL